MTPTELKPQSDTDKHDLRALIKEVTREASRTRTPLFIALLAAFLALVSMAHGAAEKQAMVAQIEAANQFAFFQAKNIRKTTAEVAAATFQNLGATDLATQWQSIAERYESERSEILETARTEQNNRESAIRQGGYFGISVALLQIAIVLASSSLVYRSTLLMTGSIGLAGVAVFFAANGHGLYFDIPSEPIALGQWAMDTISALQK